MGHLALRQRVLDEHRVDGLQIILGGEIHHRQILVIELAMLLRGVAVAFDQMAEQVLVRVDVAVEVHADEAVQLQEARIDVAHETRMRERHAGDDVVAEPVDAALLRQIVHRGRIAARVDRSAHQRHRQRHERILAASISAAAAITGTDGWHTATTWMLPPRNCSISIT